MSDVIIENIVYISWSCIIIHRIFPFHTPDELLVFFSGSMKELIVVKVLVALLWSDREKKIYASEETRMFPPTPLLLTPVIPQWAGISFSCGS